MMFENDQRKQKGEFMIKINNTLELIKIITDLLDDPDQMNAHDKIDACNDTLDNWLMDPEEKKIYNELLLTAIYYVESTEGNPHELIDE